MKPDDEKIVSLIKIAHSEVEQATKLFDELTDYAAVDYASYNLLAAKARYSYLIQIAKEKGLSL